MVTPRQAQLQHLNGDTTGVGSSNDVISLTGTAGVVDSQSARIGNITDPVNLQDAATKNYVDGYFFHNPLNVVGDATIGGKLTVSGLIDPTGLVLTPQAAAPIDNSIWVKTDAISSLVYTNSGSTEVFKAGEDTEPYVAVGSGYGLTGACRIPNNTYFTGTSGDGDSWNLAGVDGNDIRLGDATASYTAGANGATVYISGGEGVIPGGIGIYGGTGAGGSTVGGNIAIISGATDTRSGNIDIYSEDGTSTSGYLNLGTGTADGGVSGEITIGTGLNVGAGDSGDIAIGTGRTTGAAPANSGDLNMSTGPATTTSGEVTIGTGLMPANGNSGGLILSTGDVTLSGVSGNITIDTGDVAVGGISGTLTLHTGDSAGNCGAINITGGNNIIGAGAEINITAGSASGAAFGGDINILAGDAKNTVGGNYGGEIFITTGDGYLGGGDIFIELGRGFASGAQETRMAMVQMIISSGPDVPYPDSGYRGYVNGGATMIYGNAGGFTVIDIYPT